MSEAQTSASALERHVKELQRQGADEQANMSPLRTSSMTLIQDSEFQLGFTSFPLSARPWRYTVGEAVCRVVGQFQALRQLRHPNLCRYLDVLVGRDHCVVLATEHFSRNLSHVLALSTTGLGEELAVNVAGHVAKALCYLNSQGLVHGHLEAESIMFAEGGGLKLSGHGLGHIVRHGRLVDFYLAPRQTYLAPELALPTSTVSSAVAKGSCKSDVWSLGIIVLETLYGVWRVDDANDFGDFATGEKCGTLADTIRAAQALVQLETLRLLRRCSISLVKHVQDGGSGSEDLAWLTAPEMFSLVEAGKELPGLGWNVCFADVIADAPLRRLQNSYKRWLRGQPSAVATESLRDFWTTCLTLDPARRPSPADLVTHPGVLATFEGSNEIGTQTDKHEPVGLRWTRCSALRSERLLVKPPKDLGEALAEATTPFAYLRSVGIDVEDVFYWWSLAGGDAFEELAARLRLRPVPHIFQLPLCTRDRGDDDDRGDVMDFVEGGGIGASAELTKARGSHEHFFLRSLWGPPNTLCPQSVGVDLRDLCRAVAAVERLGTNAARSIRPTSPYSRQHHFAYQWLRTRHFQRLLLTVPGSRREIVVEAAEDVPPLLRPKIWAALLGADCESDRGCWNTFYEQLLASPVDLTGEEQRLAVQYPLSHEQLNHPKGRQRLERLVHAILRANPSLTRMDGLGALAAPAVVLYPDNEPAAFLFLQRTLHLFLWHFFAEESPMKRRQCTHLFGALLRFADPQLEFHLQSIGMQPDMYASLWFPTWFAQLLPLNQLFLLWDVLLLRPPQFPLFVGVCIMHYFRRALLSLDEVSHASSFLASCAQMIDVAVLAQASLALFQAVPASVTLPLYPRHSAGDALLTGPGSSGPIAIDTAWNEEGLQQDPGSSRDVHEANAREFLGQRAMEQWRQCEWWRKRAASAPTPPLITVDDLLSFRKRCFVLDVRTMDEFAEGRFQASVHVRDPEEGDLKTIVPPEVLSMGGTPGPSVEPDSDCAPGTDISGMANPGSEQGDAAAPWFFAFDASEGGIPELRLRLVVVVGGRDDYGSGFAARLLRAGVRHVVCLLGGAAALKADAQAYLTSDGS